MKKRKPPILLISVIIVLFIVVAMMNLPKDDKPEVQSATQESRETASKEDLAKQSKTQGSKLRSNAEAEMDRRMANVKEGESIMVKKPRTDEKPKPNDSSLVGQWYSNDSVVQQNPSSGK